MRNLIAPKSEFGKPHTRSTYTSKTANPSEAKKHASAHRVTILRATGHRHKVGRLTNGIELAELSANVSS